MKGKKGSSGKTKKIRLKSARLKFYADSDRTGSVKESEKEWKLRKKPPGAIIVFNCDRDGALSPDLDYEDNDILTSSELKDFSKLIVKRNKRLRKDYDSFVRLSSTDARRVRIFDDFTAGAKAVIGNTGGLIVEEYPLTDIRKRDYTFAIEALEPVKKKNSETIRINIVTKKGAKEKYSSYALFTIAPWLLLSNIEEVDKAYVARTSDNGPFITNLHSILGAKLHVFNPSPDPLDRWVQDVIEIGFSSSPQTVMHQFINSGNARNYGERKNLLDKIRADIIGPDCGHINIPDKPYTSLDSFGNLEVTPPLKKYPYGRIFYGYPDPAYSSNHMGEDMNSEVENILKANKYQPPVRIPTNWLTVGHVDEFLSFVPNLKAGSGEKPYKLLQASPKEAIRLCKKLKKAKLGSAKICEGKGGYEITVEDFLKNTHNLLKVNLVIDKILTRIRRKFIRKQFDLPYIKGKDDIIRIPVIFNGTISGSKVVDAIARTAGIVNCLVVKPYVIAPKPFGPKDGAGKDVFEEYTRKRLKALGLKFRPVDDWNTYHLLQGEIHCGTNTKRIPPKGWKWWDSK